MDVAPHALTGAGGPPCAQAWAMPLAQHTQGPTRIIVRRFSPCFNFKNKEIKMNQATKCSERHAAIEAAQRSLDATEDFAGNEESANLHEAAFIAHRAAGDTEAADAHYRATIARRFAICFPSDEIDDFAFDASIVAHEASDAANGANDPAEVSRPTAFAQP